MSNFKGDGINTRTTVDSNGVHSSTVAYQYTVKSTEALASGDTIEIAKLPSGAQVQEVTLVTDELDSGSAIVLSVGDSANASRYIGDTTVAQSGGVARGDQSTLITNVDSVSKETLLATVVTAPATQVNGAILKVSAVYTSSATL